MFLSNETNIFIDCYIRNKYVKNSATFQKVKNNILMRFYYS